MTEFHQQSSWPGLLLYDWRHECPILSIPWVSPCVEITSCKELVHIFRMPCCRRKELGANCLHAIFLASRDIQTLWHTTSEQRSSLPQAPEISGSQGATSFSSATRKKHEIYQCPVCGSTLIPTIPGGNSIEKNPTNPVNPVTFYKMVHFQTKKWLEQ